MSNTPESALPEPVRPLVPHPEPASDSDQLANEIDNAMAGSGWRIEPIPLATRQKPSFRAGLYLRVFFGLVLTGLFIWAAVRGLDWLSLFGIAVTTAIFWVITLARFRGVRIRKPG
jgi:hypothetical protein